MDILEIFMKKFLISNLKNDVQRGNIDNVIANE